MHPQPPRGCRRARRRVEHGAGILALLLVAAGPVAAAEDAALEVGLRPVSTSLEAGKPYLVGFTVRYPCGASRTIHLTASGPDWAESAVPPNFRTRADRCLEGFQGEYSENVLVDVYQDAVEGTTGNLTVTATDGNATASATVGLKVRQLAPRAEISGADTPLHAVAGETVTVNLTTAYTMWKPGRIRWIAEAPEGWRVAVPAAQTTDAGEDRTVLGTFVVTVPATANGTGEVEVHAVLVNRTGARVAESPVVQVRVDAVPPSAPQEEPVEGGGGTAPQTPKTVPPRAPLWLLGGVVLVAMVGIYALEAREERRRP